MSSSEACLLNCSSSVVFCSFVSDLGSIDSHHWLSDPHRTWAFLRPLHVPETSREWTLVSLFSSATNQCIVSTWFWKWSQSQAPSLSVCVCLVHGGVSELWSPCCMCTNFKNTFPQKCVLYLCSLRAFDWVFYHHCETQSERSLVFALNSQSQCSDLQGWHLEHLPLSSERDLSFTQTLLPMVWAWPSLLNILPIISLLSLYS